MSKPWTKEDIFYLQENWGNKSIPAIAKYLNKTTVSVQRKAQRLNLGPWLNSGEYITTNQLWKTLGLGNGNGYRKTSWIKNRNFPIKYKRSGKRRTQIVYIQDFWEWANTNKDFLDFSKLEPLSLGEEPDWVNKKRIQDRMRHIQVTNDLWTTYEDNKLLDMLKSYRYTTKQIANYLHRTEQAVLQRINKLNVPYRPIPESKHNKWTDEEVTILKDKLLQGYNYVHITEYIPNRSEKAIKSKVYQMYGTQDLSKICVQGTFTKMLK